MKIGTKLGLISFGVLVIMLSISGISHQVVTKLMASNDSVEHTLRTLRDLEVLYVNVADAESQSRGYLLAGDESYMAPHRNAVAQIHPTLEDLRLLSVDNPAMLKQLDDVEGLINEKLGYVREYIELRRENKLDQAMKIFSTNKGKELMDQIRTDIRRMMDGEMESFNLEKTAAHKTAENMFRIIALGSILAVLFVISLTIFFTQDITGSIRRLIRAADRLSSGKYEFVNASAGTEELSELAVSFNQISNSLRAAVETAAEEREGRDQALKLLESVRHTADKLHSLLVSWLNVAAEHKSEFAEYPKVSNRLVESAQGASENAEQLKHLSQQVVDLAKQKENARQNELKLADEIHSLISTIKDKTHSAAQGVTTLADRVEEMGEIVATMDNIASGSSLISLTAAIESSRNGTGFQVLIDELKSISQASKQDSVKAKQILSHIQSTANRTILNSQDATRSIDLAVGKLDQVAAKLEKLMSPLEEMHKAALQLFELTARHASVQSSLRHDVEHIHLQVAEEEMFRNQAYDTAEELRSVAHELKGLVDSRQPVA